MILDSVPDDYLCGDFKRPIMVTISTGTVPVLTGLSRQLQYVPVPVISAHRHEPENGSLVRTDRL